MFALIMHDLSSLGAKQIFHCLSELCRCAFTLKCIYVGVASQDFCVNLMERKCSGLSSYMCILNVCGGMSVQYI